MLIFGCAAITYIPISKIIFHFSGTRFRIRPFGFPATTSAPFETWHPAPPVGLRPFKGGRGSASPAPAPTPFEPSPWRTCRSRGERRDGKEQHRGDFPAAARQRSGRERGLARSGKGPARGYATGAATPALVSLTSATMSAGNSLARCSCGVGFKYRMRTATVL